MIYGKHFCSCFMTSDVVGISLAAICKPRTGLLVQSQSDEDPVVLHKEQSLQQEVSVLPNIITTSIIDDVEEKKNEIRTVIESLGECQRCHSKKIMIEDSYLVCDECGKLNLCVEIFASFF